MSNAHALMYAGLGLVVAILYARWKYRQAKRQDACAMEQMRRHVRGIAP